ncbi:hypothetical protein pb186bvf_015308 [Paramecium bursaria]
MGIGKSVQMFNGIIQVKDPIVNYNDGYFRIHVKYIPQAYNFQGPIYANVFLISEETYKTQKTTMRNELQKILLYQKEIYNMGDISFTVQLDKVKLGRTQSHYAKIQNVTYSTTHFIQIFLSKADNKERKISSSQIIQNTRKILVLKVKNEHILNQPLQLSLNIQPKQSFIPIVNISIFKSVFYIGDTIEGIMIINNQNSDSSLILNKFSIIQQIFIKEKSNNHAKNNLPQNIISQIGLDSVHQEIKEIQIRQQIGQNFKDQLSYVGQLYEVRYHLEFQLEWENGYQDKILQAITILDK